MKQSTSTVKLFHKKLPLGNFSSDDVNGSLVIPELARNSMLYYKLNISMNEYVQGLIQKQK